MSTGNITQNPLAKSSLLTVAQSPTYRYSVSFTRRACRREYWRCRRTLLTPQCTLTVSQPAKVISVRSLLPSSLWCQVSNLDLTMCRSRASKMLVIACSKPSPTSRYREAFGCIHVHEHHPAGSDYPTCDYLCRGAASQG